MSPLTDKQLMFRVRDGDLDKLGILFQRHNRMLYNFFLRMTSSVAASEDLVQEVFFRMLKYRHTYRGDSEFSVWMFRIARNSRADYFSKQKRHASDDGLEPDMLESLDAGPSKMVENEQENRLLHAALARLSDEDREVLLLSRFEEVKYKEIANMLGCLEGTVKARVHRAIKRLRDTFFELSGEQV